MTRTILGGLVLSCVFLASFASAQDAPLQTRAQLSMMLTAAPGTPDGKGLLSTVLADARTAATEAAAAERAGNDVTMVKQRAGAVLAALDPALAPHVKGTYGVRPGVQALVQQITQLADSDTKPDAARMLPDALTAAKNVLRWCEVAIDVAQRLQLARTADEALPLAQQLTMVTRQMAAGTNTGKERRPIPSANDGGLLFVQLQLQMLKVGRDAVATRPATVAVPTDPRSQPLPPIPLRSTVAPVTGVSR